MKLFAKKKSDNFLDLSEKKQKELLLKAAIGANKKQLQLEKNYLKLREQS